MCNNRENNWGKGSKEEEVRHGFRGFRARVGSGSRGATSAQGRGRRGAARRMETTMTEEEDAAPRAFERNMNERSGRGRCSGRKIPGGVATAEQQQQQPIQQPQPQPQLPLPVQQRAFSDVAMLRQPPPPRQARSNCSHHTRAPAVKLPSDCRARSASAPSKGATTVHCADERKDPRMMSVQEEMKPPLSLAAAALLPLLAAAAAVRHPPPQVPVP
jgi:hypothetical protein